MDEVLALVAVDLGGRAYSVFEVILTPRRAVGHRLDLPSLREPGDPHRMNLHAKVLYGRNDHQG